jgi:6-phosphogluconate dehydrogenase
MQENASYAFGLIGLGVMGRNFILNVAEKGYHAMGYDLDEEKVRTLIEIGKDTGRVHATTDAETFIKKLARPRKIMLLVPAGEAVDHVIDALIPLLDPGDIIVDGGNSFYADTDRREARLAAKDIHFFGAGVSGGAEGARKGPSIMPGGSREAYAHLKPIFEAVAAKYEGEPCVAYLGPRSAGNYVKMVHNGIEYGMMQLTAEAYDLLKIAGGFENEKLSKLFKKWNQGRLQSFLVEISGEILGTPDPLTGGHLVDYILDKAKQKGTGKWTSQNGMDLGIPMPTIDMAVSLRQVSALKDQRLRAEGLYPKPKNAMSLQPEELAEKTEAALYFAFIMCYAQGLHLLSEASREYDYELDLGGIAKIWRAGCIIRAALLADITEAFREDAELPNLLLSPRFVEKIRETVPAARDLVSFAAKQGIPAAALSSSLSYFETYTSGCLPLNLVQAQRDYFGSHTYERTDREGVFHTEW